MDDKETNLSVEVQLNRGEDGTAIMTIESQREVAKGGWSQVTLVRAIRQGAVEHEEYVRKRARQPKAFKHRELELHCELHHLNIVEIAAWWYEGTLDEDSDIRYLNLLLTPYCPTTLAQLDLPLPEPLVFDCASKVLSALEYLHAPERYIAHRDLKMENVLVKLSSEHLSLVELYLCDFGCAKRILPTEQNGCEVGEQKIRAPELLRQRGYGTYTVAVDIFALGLLLCRLLLGNDLLRPRETHAEQLEEYERVFREAVTENEIVVVLQESFSRSAPDRPALSSLEFIANLLLPDPKTRPEAGVCMRSIQS